MSLVFDEGASGFVAQESWLPAPVGPESGLFGIGVTVGAAGYIFKREIVHEGAGLEQASLRVFNEPGFGLKVPDEA